MSGRKHSGSAPPPPQHRESLSGAGGVTKAPSSIFQVLVLSMEVFQPVKVLPSKMVVKPSSVSAGGDGLTAPTKEDYDERKDGFHGFEFRRRGRWER